MAKLWLSVGSGCLCILLLTLGPGPIFSIGNSQKTPSLISSKRDRKVDVIFYTEHSRKLQGLGMNRWAKNTAEFSQFPLLAIKFLCVKRQFLLSKRTGEPAEGKEESRRTQCHKVEKGEGSITQANIHVQKMILARF